MKLINENKEQNWYLIKNWVTEAGLQAVVLKCRWKNKHFLLHNHYTGYVKVKEGDTTEYFDSENISVHGGVTFHGEMQYIESNEKMFPGKWVGFDMGHYGDEKIHDQENYAISECESLAKQIVDAQVQKS